MLSYSEIRKMFPLRWRMLRFGDIICSLISPYFTMLFIEKKLIPNFVTMLMIIFGIVGAVFFSFPSLYMKIIGVLFFYLWYIMDCSDGQIARITKTFSKYGREMDYMAHLICHPLMNISLFISLVQLNKYNIYIIAIVCIIFISTELINRMFILFNAYLLVPTNTNLGNTTPPNIIKYILLQFTNYPTFILLFPFLYFLDYFFNFPSFTILVIGLIIYVISTIKGIYKLLKLFYFS